jgi:hypothetical protein
MNKSEPKTIVEYLPEVIDVYDFDGPIDQTLSFLQGIRNKYRYSDYPNLSIDVDVVYNYESEKTYRLRLYTKRKETEEEMKLRKEKESFFQKKKEQEELALYKRLQKKFG